jgi:hypothetical protein
MNYDFEHGKRWVVKKGHMSIGMFMPNMDYKEPTNASELLELIHNTNEDEGYIVKEGDIHIMVKSKEGDNKFNMVERLKDKRFNMCHIGEDEAKEWYTPLFNR